MALEPDWIVYPSVLLKKGDIIKLEQPWANDYHELLTIRDTKEWRLTALTEWGQLAALPRGFFLINNDWTYSPIYIQGRRVN